MNIEQLEYQVGVEDPKEVILKKIGNELDKITTIFGPRVLVAMAPSPIRSKGGIIYTDNSKKESRWQGKAAVVLKCGEDAFKQHPRYPEYKWEGPIAEVGDWVHFFNSDAREIGIGGIACRYIWDSDILGIVSDCEAVY